MKMKINGKQVLLCLIWYITGIALPMALMYCGVSREVLEYGLYCLVLLLLILVFDRNGLLIGYFLRKKDRF